MRTTMGPATPPFLLTGMSMSSTAARILPMACSLMPVIPISGLTRRGPAMRQSHYSGGTINVIQNAAPGGLPGPRGILAWIDGVGSASVTTDPGTTIRVVGTPFGGPAVFLFSSDPTAHTNTLTANVASTIESVGPAISTRARQRDPTGRYSSQ